MLARDLKLLLDLGIGDGWLGFKDTRRTYPYMRVEHSVKQQDYAVYKETLLSYYNYSLSSRIFISTAQKSYGKQYYRIDLHQDPRIYTAYKWLYNRRRKSVDKAFLRQADAETLAFWFMDDGNAKLTTYSRNKDKSRFVYEEPKVSCYRLATMCFSREENELIMSWLREKFSIHSTYVKHSNGQYQIAVYRTEDKDRFKETIEQYILPSMYYKIQFKHSFKGACCMLVAAEETEREDILLV